jgi:hypothetical protein
MSDHRPRWVARLERATVIVMKRASPADYGFLGDVVMD